MNDIRLENYPTLIHSSLILPTRLNYLWRMSYVIDSGINDRAT